MNRQAWVKRLWMSNAIFVLATIAICMLVDGNGDIAGLNEKASLVILWTVVALGIGLDILTGIYDRRRWWACLLIGLFYLVIIYPAVPLF